VCCVFIYIYIYLRVCVCVCVCVCVRVCITIIGIRRCVISLREVTVTTPSRVSESHGCYVMSVQQD